MSQIITVNNKGSYHNTTLKRTIKRQTNENVVMGTGTLEF